MNNVRRNTGRTMQMWEGRAGGKDGYFFLLGGLWSPFCRVLEELASSFRPASCPASLRSDAVLLRSAKPGFSVLVCVCMSVGSDHHSKLYTVYQHLGEVVL